MKLSEYERDGSQRERLGRHIYLQAIKEHAPQVLEILAEEPLAAARLLLAGNPHLVFHDWRGLNGSQHDRVPAVSTLRESLRQWGKSFHLDDPWYYTKALETLQLWSRDEDALRRRDWAPSSGSPSPALLSPQETTLDLRLGYYPTRETRAAAERRLERQFHEAKDELFARAEGRASDLKLSKTREIFREERFRWLVEYQINESTMYGVWKNMATHLTEDAVRKGIHQAADAIQLHLRSPRSR